MRKKIIRVTLTLADGTKTFTAQGDNRLQSTGLAISTNITYGNGAISPTAQITIYGLPMSAMAPLFRVQWNTMSAILNTVKIEVGEQGGELTKAYEGNITFATINMNAAPNVALVITSQMAVVEKMRATPPITIPDGEDAAKRIGELAKEMGYQFENYGASHILTHTSLNGSNLEKIEKLAAMCDFDLYVEQGLIVICKKGTARPVKIPVVTPKDRTLNGYPEPDQRGISFTCLYDPMIKFGGIITIKDSLIEIANADWRIYGLVSTLEANIPQGKWQCAVNATWRDSKDAAVQR
ncbi:baseplate hub [Acinetobacter phage Ab65]|nr:baseplate hub [Acinetobacter phage Ab59]WMC00598.1 baseplate hub [Acinetobacter phage Ab65]